MTSSFQGSPSPVGNSNNRPTISPQPLLLICQELGHLAELKRLIDHLAGVFSRIVIAVDLGLGNTHRAGLVAGLADCRARGVHCVDLTGQSLGPDGAVAADFAPPTIDPRIAGAFREAISPLRLSLSPQIVAALEWRASELLQRQAVGTALAERVNPGLVIVAEDSLEHQSAAFIKVFRERGVRTIIVPFTLPSPIEVAEGSPPIVVGDPLSSLIATRFPQWMLDYKGTKRLRLAPLDILARELLGLAPPHPWVYNSGGAAAIAVESPAMASLYASFGFPEDQLIVVGSSVDDVLYASLQAKEECKRRLCEELGADPRKPILVWAVLADQFHQSHRVVPEYSSYGEVVDFIAAELARLSPDFTVVARLHPRSVMEEIAPIVSAHGIQVSRWPTEKLIPLGDFYVATTSATLRWAVACGVPAINYDLYQYDFMENLNSAKGVVRVTSKRDFSATVRRYADDPEYRRSLQDYQRGSAPEWGRLDGHSGDRLRQLCIESARGVARRADA